MQSGFVVNIPEKFVEERINQLVAFKLRHEKLKEMIKDGVVNHLSGELVSIRKGVETLLQQQLTKDLTAQRDLIIDSFIESKRTVINLNGVTKGDIKDPMAHKELPKLITFLSLFKQALIVGPTGSGKSTLAKQAADAMKLPFASFSCNMEASKSELVGFANINGYVESNFLRFYENGGVFLVDEYDAMSPSIAVVLNAAFDRSGQIAVPNRTDKPVATKHPDFYCILAGNTWGSGSVEYHGRDMQDAAFLDRFKACRMHIDYDTDLEKRIAGNHYPWMMEIRDFVNSNMDTEKFSTRSIHDVAVLLENGFSKKEIVGMLSYHWDETVRSTFATKVGGQ